MTKQQLIEAIKNYPDDYVVVIVNTDGRCNDVEIIIPTFGGNEFQLIPTKGRT